MPPGRPKHSLPFETGRVLLVAFEDMVGMNYRTGKVTTVRARILEGGGPFQVLNAEGTFEHTIGRRYCSTNHSLLQPVHAGFHVSTTRDRHIARQNTCWANSFITITHHILPRLRTCVARRRRCTVQVSSCMSTLLSLKAPCRQMDV